jgi:hypothetical protein
VVLITNVDDILYKETGGRNRILTERLITYFKKSYGNEDVTVQYKPQSWNGYALAWSTDGSCVTLSMELHIVQLARDYVPESRKHPSEDGAERSETGVRRVDWHDESADWSRTLGNERRARELGRMAEVAPAYRR